MYIESTIQNSHSIALSVVDYKLIYFNAWQDPSCSMKNVICVAYIMSNNLYQVFFNSRQGFGKVDLLKHTINSLKTQYIRVCRQ